MEQRFSEWLAVQAESLDSREGIVPSLGDEEARHILEQIAEALIEGREAFTEPRFDVLEKALRNEPDIAEGEIDRVLTTRALSGMRGMVDRLMKLSKLERVKTPSDQTAKYVREATRAYFYGLIQASAVMSRIALEQALKEVLGRQGIEDFVKFKELRNEAEQKGILDGVTGPAACEFAKDANEVIHHRPTDAKGALDILTRSRGLIVQIYTAASGQSSVPHLP